MHQEKKASWQRQNDAPLTCIIYLNNTNGEPLFEYQTITTCETVHFADSSTSRHPNILGVNDDYVIVTDYDVV